MPERFLAATIPQHEVAELYRLMVVGIREVAVFLMDPNGIITVWNKAAQDMKGYTADDAIGQHLSLLYTDADREAGHADFALNEAARDGVYTEERWRKRKDGSLFWAHIVLTALRDEQNKLLGFSKVTMDLTRHKLLEQCEKEKREIDLILTAAEAGTWQWAVTSDAVTVSHHLLALLGESGNAPKMALGQWLAYVHPDERDPFAGALARARDSANGTALQTDLRLRHGDGAFHWYFLHVSWQRDNPAGEALLLGVCVAIDQLKEAERERSTLSESLQRERARFADVLEQLPSGVVLAEVPSGKFAYQNRMAVDLLGADVRDIVSYREYERFHFLDQHGQRIDTDALPLVRLLRGATSITSTQDVHYCRADGARLHLAVTTALIDGTGEAARLAVAVMHDITQLKQAQLSAATEKERAVVTLAAITDGVVTLDLAGRVLSLNPAAERMTGVPAAAARGELLTDLLTYTEPHPESHTELHAELDANAPADNSLGAHASSPAERAPSTGWGAERIASAIRTCLREQRSIGNLPHLNLHSRTGQHYAVEHALAPVALEDGTPIGAVLTLHDVTQSKALLRQLGWEASHDALTGLVNRREFEVRLQRAIERARHGSEGAVMLYMDLDQFKIVNDTCGHQSGDELLKLLAASYRIHVRERDCFARIGGDEFALIVEHVGVEDALQVAHKLLDVTRAFRYICKGRPFQIGVSIGLTRVDPHTGSVEEAMRRADHACYLAKEHGRNRVYVHNADDQDMTQRRNDMHWVTRLTHAFHDQQLQLYCQPIVALGEDATDTRLHYEILLRLKDGEEQPIPPGSFMPAAERYDVILKIDRWVLENTLNWLAAHPQHTSDLSMCSINLSRRSLADPAFHQFAADLIDRSSVAPSKLCFEITESGAIADMQKTTDFIRALSARGCRFSLDDFGTGMTSFSYLKDLPVDFIKIDGSFIQMMGSSAVDYEMVRFTNDISHMMGRKTIAEYVTDPAMLADLTRIGVDFAQGYLVGKPRPLGM